MTWGLVAVAGATLVGGAVASDSARKAGHSQQDAANAAAGVQQPWVDAGTTALGQLQTGLAPGGQFSQSGQDLLNNDPGYQFRLQQGLNSVDSSAAARGGALSGGALKGLQRYAQDYASNEYNNAFNQQTSRFNRLASLAQIGQVGATNQGNLTTSGAAANAAGQVGSSNAITGSLGSIGNAYMQQQYMNGSSYGGSGGLSQVPGGQGYAQPSPAVTGPFPD